MAAAVSPRRSASSAALIDRGTALGDVDACCAAGAGGVVVARSGRASTVASGSAGPRSTRCSMPTCLATAPCACRRGSRRCFFCFWPCWRRSASARSNAGVAAGPRSPRALVIVVFLMRDTPRPMQINPPLASEGLATPPPAYLTPRAELPAIYRAVDGAAARRDSRGVAIRRPLVRPALHVLFSHTPSPVAERLQRHLSAVVLARASACWRGRCSIRARPRRRIGGATHVVVHRPAWKDNTGARVGAWLRNIRRHADRRRRRRGAVRAAGPRGLARCGIQRSGH